MSKTIFTYMMPHCGVIVIIRPKEIPMLRVATGEKVWMGGGGENSFFLFFNFMTCHVKLYNNSQKKNRTLNSSHEN